MEREQTIPLPNRIAALVHAHFDALPARYKPRTRDDGSREWIPMSGFILNRGTLCIVFKIPHLFKQDSVLIEEKDRVLRRKR